MAKNETVENTETKEVRKVPLFIESTDKDADAVFISVNNETWSIPRDKEVYVPDYVAEQYKLKKEADRKNRAKMNALVQGRQ